MKNFPLLFKLFRKNGSIPKGVTAILLILGMLLSLALPQVRGMAGETVRKKVRIGYVISHHVMEGEQGEKKSGLGYEYLQKISYYTNWEYEYIYGEWGEIYQKLLDGEIDVLEGVCRTAEREKMVLFPDYSMGTETYYIYANGNNAVAGMGMDGLRGSRIGVNKDTIMESILREWNNNGSYGAKIKLYSGNNSLYMDFGNGSVDAIVDTDISAENEREMVPMTRLGSSEYYMVVAKDRKDLLEELNVAQNKIVSTDPAFVKKLSEKYFSYEMASAKMPTDEKAWFLEHKKITVGYMIDYLPFSDREKDGSATGLVVDVMNEILSKLGQSKAVSVQYVGYRKTADLIQSIKTGKIDVAFPINDNVTLAEDNEIYLTSSVITCPMNLVFKGQYSEDKTRRMAVKQGNEIQEEYTKKHFPNAKIKYYETFEKELDALRAGKVDSIVVNGLRKDGYLSLARYRGFKAIELLETSSRAMAVNEGNNILLSILNRGISKLPTNFTIVASYPYSTKLGQSNMEDFLMENWTGVMVVLTIVIVLIAAFLAFSINARRKRKILDTFAHRDSMTGLLNRRSFDEQMDQEGSAVPREDTLFVGMDLNGLKRANDTLGHAAGDELICGAAGCMKEVLGEYGRIYRTGGDEFIAILKGRHIDWSKVIAELKQSFSDWKGTYSDEISVAVGCCSSDEDPEATVRDMMRIADERLYEDKKSYYVRKGIDRRRG